MEKIRITQQELEMKLNDFSEEGEKALETYFDFDPKTREYHLKEQVELIDAGSKGLIGDVAKKIVLGNIVPMANNWSKRRRNRRYRKMKAAFPDRLRIVSEGDSWFQHPQPGMLDVIDQLAQDHTIYSLGAAMEELSSIFHQKEYLEAIANEKPHLFLLSGGGNDILGEQFLNFLVDEFDPGAPGLKPERFLNRRFARQMKHLKFMYHQIAEEIKEEFPGLPMVVHAYDYIIPNNPMAKLSVSWLGVFMDKKKIEVQEDKAAIIHFLIKSFSSILIELEEKYEHVHFVNALGKVKPDQWNDEIHPTSAGFKVVADEFRKTINSLNLV